MMGCGTVKHKSMDYPTGIPKGVHVILEERGINTSFTLQKCSTCFGIRATKLALYESLAL